MRTFTFSLFIFISMQTYSQQQDFVNLDIPDTEAKFIPVQHASIVFEIGGKVIYVDPWGDTEKYDGLKTADLILITDIHPDHYSPENIKYIMNNYTMIVAPAAVFDLMPEYLKQKTKVLKNGENSELPGFKLNLTAIPMYNMPESEESPHVKGRGNGYVIKTGDYRIYISGDSGNTPEMQALKNIDLAFICMNLPYTMSVEEAASVVNTFKPKMVCPYHYRNADKTMSDTQRFCELVGLSGIACVNLSWYTD